MLKVPDSPYIKSYHFDDADSFIEAILRKGELYSLFNEQFIFRGHSTDRYELLPSALRGFLSLDNLKASKSVPEHDKELYSYLSTTELTQIQVELKILQDFFNVCDKNGLYVPHIESLRNSFYPGVDAETLLLGNKWIPQEYWELAALAQHHGIKTRLLDWSHDLYVALYFATTGVYYDPKERVDPQKCFMAFSKGEKNPPTHNMEIWALDINIVMVNPAKIPLHIIQPRYHNNDNLCAQRGIFTFWESIYPGFPQGDVKNYIKQTTDRRTLDERLDHYFKENDSPPKPYLYRVTIPQDAAYSIYSHIEKMGYNASTMFPGYDGVARFLREHNEIRQYSLSHPLQVTEQ